MAFSDPSSQQYYPSPLGPSFSTGSIREPSAVPAQSAATYSKASVNLSAPESAHFKSNPAVGDLFKGIGDTLSTVTKAADTVIKDKIDKEIFLVKDRVQSEFGVPEAVDIVKNSGAPGTTGEVIEQGDAGPARSAPSAIKKLGARLEGMKDALDAGDWTSSYYSARLETELQRVREMFPGYREEIDTQARRVLGQDPANTLVAELRRNAEEFNKKNAAAVDAQQKWYLQNANYLPPGFDYSKRDFARDYEYVLKQKQFEHTQDELRKPMIEERKVPDGRGGFRTEYMTAPQRQEVGMRQFTEIGTNVVNKIMTESIDASGLTPHNIRNILDQAKLGKQKWTPEMEAEMKGKLDYIEGVARRSVMQEALRPHVPGDYRNFRYDIADNRKLEEAVSHIISPITQMKDDITKQNWGIAGYNASRAQAMIDKKNMELLQNETYLTVAAAKPVIGEQAVNIYLTYSENKGQTPLSSLARALNGEIGVRNMLKPNGSAPLIDSFDRLGKSKALSSNEIQSIIGSHLNSVTNPEVIKALKPEHRVNMTKNLFTNLDQLFEGGRVAVKDYKSVFNMLANENVSRGIIELAKNDPDVMTRYQNFVLKSFKSVYLADVGEANKVITDPYYEVTLNKTGDQLIGGYNRQKFPNADPTALQAEAKLQNLNRGLRILSPILKANGMTVADALVQVGVDLNAPKNNFWQGVFDALKSAVTPNEATGDDKKTIEDNKSKAKKFKERGRNLETPQNEDINDIWGKPGKRSGRGNLSDETMISMNVDGVDVPVNPKSGEPGNPQFAGRDETKAEFMARIKKMATSLNINTENFNKMLKHGEENRESVIEDRRTPDDLRFEELSHRYNTNSDLSPNRLTDEELKWLKIEKVLQNLKKMRVNDEYFEETFPETLKTPGARDKLLYHKRRNPRPQE